MCEVKVSKWWGSSVESSLPFAEGHLLVVSRHAGKSSTGEYSQGTLGTFLRHAPLWSEYTQTFCFLAGVMISTYEFWKSTFSPKHTMIWKRAWYKHSENVTWRVKLCLLNVGFTAIKVMFICPLCYHSLWWRHQCDVLSSTNTNLSCCCCC